MKTAITTLALAAVASAAPRPQTASTTSTKSSSQPDPKVDTCSPVQLIWARGTLELQSSYGTFVGDGYVPALQKAIPSITAYNVVYPAWFTASSEDAGIKDATDRIKSQAAKCPEQKFILGGYSQGAAVVHHVAADITPDILTKVIATTTFGDPGMRANKTNPSVEGPQGPIPAWPDALDGKTHFACSSSLGGDSVCENGGLLGLPGHISYRLLGNFIDETVKFVQSRYPGTVK